MGPEASRTGRWIEVNGATLYCEDRGAGPPIVLIHAGLISGAIWEPLLPALIDDFRVIIPDSRGHGRSTNPSGEMSYGQIADDVAAVITSLELDRPVVGGYSDGGQVALEIGARHPEAAGGLIIGAAYPDFVTTGLREFLRAYLGADDAGTPDVAAVEARLGELADPVKSLHPGGAEQWHALVQQSARMWLDYEGLTADDLQRIKAPALVLRRRPRRGLHPRSDGVSLPGAAERRARGLSALRSPRADHTRADRHLRRHDPRLC